MVAETPDCGFVADEDITAFNVMWDKFIDMGLVYRRMPLDEQMSLRAHAPWLPACHLLRGRMFGLTQPGDPAISLSDMEEAKSLLVKAGFPLNWATKWSLAFDPEYARRQLLNRQRLARKRRLTEGEIADFFLTHRQGLRLAMMFGKGPTHVGGRLLARDPGCRERRSDNKPATDFITTEGGQWQVYRQVTRYSFSCVRLCLEEYVGELLPDGWHYWGDASHLVHLPTERRHYEDHGLKAVD